MAKKKVVQLFVCSLLLVFGSRVRAQSCPQSCLCFSSTVRCMFLHLQRLPTVPKQTKVLDLRFNAIREIPAGIFKNQPSLNTLLLNNNHITRIQNGSFEGMTNLRHLYLHKNRIKVLETDAFKGLEELQQLYLHFNQIQNLEPATFSNLRSLDRLFLHNNKLTRIAAGTFGNMTALRRLRLDSNALVCDCNLMWLADMLKGTRGLTQAAATCEQPSDLQGKSLAALTESQIKCEKPVLMEEPEDVDVDFGGTAYFNCKAEGDPDPDIRWLHNDNEIPEGDGKGRYSVLRDGTTLMIEDARAEDRGVVECTAKNALGQVKSRRAAVKYRPLEGTAAPPADTARSSDDRRGTGTVKPELTVTPIDQSVQVGQRVEFECKASGKPEPTIAWTKDGVPLARKRNRYQHQVEGSLVITDAGFDDSGTYECLAANFLGSAAAAARLHVQETPSFLEAPQDRHVEAGADVEFPCRAAGTPTPKLTWFKNGRALESRDGRYEVRDEGRALRIRNVGKSDEATYLCRADNAGGTRDAGADLVIRDKAPPSFLRKPQNLEAGEGEEVHLVCSAVGDPTPAVSWRKDGGGRVETDARRRVTADGTLRIVGATKRDDEGLYQCIAENSLGVTTTSAFLTVRARGPNDGRFPVGESVVRESVSEAKRQVDRAINDTLRSLFANPRANRPSDLLRVARFPNEHVLDIARAAEVYETALLAVRRHVGSGATFNNLSDFSYERVLSESNLRLMANLSGCLIHRRVLDCTDMCFHSKYRTLDGTCNNLQHPMWGASETAFRRLLKPEYENGFSTPIGWTESVLVSGFRKPSARLVSSRVIATRSVSPDELYSHMLMQWGQFLDHDLDLAPPTVSTESFVDGTDCARSCDNAPPCFPIRIPDGDERIAGGGCMEFTRSSPVCGSGGTSVLFNMVQPREQLNVLTAYIDGSQVYGSSEAEARHVRDASGGLLRAGIITPSGKNLLPFNDHWPVDCRRDHRESDVGCFLAGDVRVNEQLGLIAMHTVWFREHNRVARSLRRFNAHWDGDMLYHEARKIVGAQMQHVTYAHWLPKVLGEAGTKMLGPYRGYDPRVEAGISNSFATAALRFGHTLINPVLHRLNSSFEPIPHGHVHLRNAFFSPFRIIEEGGIDPLLRGLFAVPAKLRKSHQLLNDELTEQLFRQVHHVALDLAAINIQRGRDHGIPSYNAFRRLCNLSEARTFDDLRHEIGNDELRDGLRRLYGHPNNVDLWVGGVSEDLVEGARTGPTFMCIIADQFRRLRDGDRFYYERPGVFSPEKLDQIKQSSLARILCDNADDIADVTLDAFVVPQKQEPNYVKCAGVPSVDLSVWTECCHDCNSAGQFNSVIGLPSRNRRSADFSYAGDKPLNGSSYRYRQHEAWPGEGDGDHRLDGIEDLLAGMHKTIRKLSRKVKKLEEELKARGSSGNNGKGTVS